MYAGWYPLFLCDVTGCVCVCVYIVMCRVAIATYVRSRKRFSLSMRVYVGCGGVWWGVVGWVYVGDCGELIDAWVGVGDCGSVSGWVSQWMSGRM